MAYMKFKGTYLHGMDAKNRLFIPAKYREPLGESFVVCRAPLPNVCIYAFPEDKRNEIAEAILAKVQDDREQGDDQNDDEDADDFQNFHNGSFLYCLWDGEIKGEIRETGHVIVTLVAVEQGRRPE